MITKYNAKNEKVNFLSTDIRIYTLITKVNKKGMCLQIDPNTIWTMHFNGAQIKVLEQGQL